MAEVQKLSIKHIDILNFLLANPMVKLQDVAAHYGITQPWLSQVIHSDMFQRLLKERQDAVFHHTVLPLKEKLTTLAHQALDKLYDRVEATNDVGELREVATSALDRIGFSPKAAPAVVNNNVTQLMVIERERLARARSLIGRPRAALLEGKPDEVSTIAPPILGGFEGQAAIPLAQAEDVGAEEGSGV